MKDMSNLENKKLRPGCNKAETTPKKDPQKSGAEKDANDAKKEKDNK